MVVWYQSGRKSGGGWFGHFLGAFYLLTFSRFSCFHFLQWWYDHKVAARVARPFPGCKSDPKNGSQFPTRPLTQLPQIGHFVLCYTFYEMKQGAMRSPLSHSYMKLAPRKTSFIPFSNHWPSINSISLCGTEDIWQQCAWSCTMQLGKREFFFLFYFTSPLFNLSQLDLFL